MSVHLSVPQAAVLPMRAGRVCLVLSTSGKRWVIPKGRIERRQTAGETALREAWEEAGLVGLLQRKPVGSYRYEKCGRDFHVTVFFMKVTEVADSFPEQDRRVRRWVRADRALRYVGDPALRRVLRRALTGGPRLPARVVAGRCALPALVEWPRRTPTRPFAVPWRGLFLPKRLLPATLWQDPATRIARRAVCILFSKTANKHAHGTLRRSR